MEGLLDTLVGQLLSKDVMLEPMQHLHAEFPKWRRRALLLCSPPSAWLLWLRAQIRARCSPQVPRDPRRHAARGRAGAVQEAAGAGGVHPRGVRAHARGHGPRRGAHAADAAARHAARRDRWARRRPGGRRRLRRVLKREAHVYRSTQGAAITLQRGAAGGARAIGVLDGEGARGPTGDRERGGTMSDESAGGEDNACAHPPPLPPQKTKSQNFPARIRTLVGGFRVLSDSRYTTENESRTIFAALIHIPWTNCGANEPNRAFASSASGRHPRACCLLGLWGLRR